MNNKGMKLYCESCREVHIIKLLDVEALVYALEAEQRHDPRLEEIQNGKIVSNRPGPDEATCLLSLVDLAWDAEGYGEHVEAGIEVRRRLSEGASVAVQQ